MHLGNRIEAVHRIAVVRANGIGDYCFSLPALAALRAAYPDAEIVLLGKPWHAEFLHNRAGPVDRAVVIPTYGGVSADPGAPEDRAALERFFQAMRAERFDLALQLHGGGRYSNAFVRALDARVTAGLRTPDAAALDRCIPYVYFQPEIWRYLEVVSLVGAPPVTIEPQVEVTAVDRAEIERLGLDRDRPLAILHPGATDPRRRWAADNFAAVGRALYEAGAYVGVIGTGAERAVVHAVIEAMKTPAFDFCDRLTLGGLVALLAQSAVVVSNDSGPLHLASAVGARTVGIFWCGNMINGGLPTRARHRPMISWRLACPVCGRNTLYDACGHAASFITDVPIDGVIDAALDLTDGRLKRRSIAA